MINIINYKKQKMTTIFSGDVEVVTVRIFAEDKFGG